MTDRPALHHARWALVAALLGLSAPWVCAQAPAQGQPQRSAPPAQQASQAPALLECTGPFGRSADEQALIKAFGAANVVREDISVGEGDTEPGNVVFPKDDRRRLEVLWHDSAKRRRPSMIRLRDGKGWGFRAPGSERTLLLGMGIADVEAINGRPFVILGFGWDSGGYAGNWKGGRLDGLSGGCALSLRFNPDDKAADAAMNRASGDREFTSTDKAIRAVRPTVAEIALGWPM